MRVCMCVNLRNVCCVMIYVLRYLFVCLFVCLFVRACVRECMRYMGLLPT